MDKANMNNMAKLVYEGVKPDATDNTRVLFKPDEFAGRTLTNPPDFAIKKDGLTFWIQTKSLLETEGQNGQAKSALYKDILAEAAGVFDWDTDEQNVNLLVVETGKGKRNMINIGEAVFGDEVFVFFRFGKREWHRENNGLFDDPRFSTKVAGVIVVKRKEHLSDSKNIKLLFINDNFKDRVEQIKSLFSDFDWVIYHNVLLEESED